MSTPLIVLKNNLNTTQECFFGYLLVSQLESVEAITSLNKQVLFKLDFFGQNLFVFKSCPSQIKKYSHIDYRSNLLEKSVDYLLNRCDMLENTISTLRDLVLDNQRVSKQFTCAESNYFVAVIELLIN